MLQKFGRLFLFFLIGFLPWSVIVSVFGTEKLGISFFHFSKEIILGIILLLGVVDMWRRGFRIKLDILDISILLYIFTLIAISFVQGISTRGIIYGLRYDAEFLFVFLFFRRIVSFWGISFREIARVFLISGGLMFALSLAVRYIFGETFLLIFWFGGHISVWEEFGPPPIYHSIPQTWIVRFQWMLEGPNQMAFFILVYIGTFLTFIRKNKKYLFFNAVVVSMLIYLLIQTYSRSGFLWLLVGFASSFFVLFFMRKGNKFYHIFSRLSWKKNVFIALALLLFSSFFVYQFGSRGNQALVRSASTSAHFQRMHIGYSRFLEQPWWHGLAQAGPASRSVHDVSIKPISFESLDPEMSHLSATFLAKDPNFVFNSEHYYIPESWYIQQLIESWLIGFLLFACTIIIFIRRLCSTPYMLVAFIGVLVMNVFLHSFESMHTSMILFLLVASLLPPLSSIKKDYAKT